MIDIPSPSIWNPMVFFFIISFIGLAIYRISRKSRPRKGEKHMIYTCGEDMEPEDLNIPPETFYEYFIDLFKIKKLRKWHSGVLNDYLLWIFVAMVVLIILMVIYW